MMRNQLRDHPRVCGEKLITSAAGLIAKGSPPRMRGKVGDVGVALAVVGITPAYAGKSRSQPRTAPRHRDHPRVCGEKMSRPPAKTRTPGLPPRMRGKEVKALLHFNWVGITPACAGKSARRQAGPPGPAPPPQMRSGWSPPPCTGRQCRTRKSTHARRARIPVPAHTPAPQ